MPRNTKGVGYFTTENIVAVLRALPEIDGTYGEVAKQAAGYGSDVSQRTIGKSVSTGRKDLKAGKLQSAFARFAQQYEQIMEENCNADANRNRALGTAFEIFDKTCERGKEEVVIPEVKRADQCRECQDLNPIDRRRHWI